MLEIPTSTCDDTPGAAASAAVRALYPSQVGRLLHTAAAVPCTATAAAATMPILAQFLGSNHDGVVLMGVVIVAGSSLKPTAAAGAGGSEDDDADVDVEDEAGACTAVWLPRVVPAAVAADSFTGAAASAAAAANSCCPGRPRHGPMGTHTVGSTGSTAGSTTSCKLKLRGTPHARELKLASPPQVDVRTTSTSDTGMTAAASLVMYT